MMFLKLYQLLKFIGLAPLEVGDKNIYLIIPICIYLCCYIISGVYCIFTENFTEFSRTNFVLKYLLYTMKLSFFTIGLCFALFRSKNWKLLLNGLRIMNNDTLKIEELVIILFFQSVSLCHGNWWVCPHQQQCNTGSMESAVLPCQKLFSPFYGIFHRSSCQAYWKKLQKSQWKIRSIRKKNVFEFWIIWYLCVRRIWKF